MVAGSFQRTEMEITEEKIPLAKKLRKPPQKGGYQLLYIRRMMWHVYLRAFLSTFLLLCPPSFLPVRHSLVAYGASFILATRCVSSTVQPYICGLCMFMLHVYKYFMFVHNSRTNCYEFDHWHQDRKASTATEHSFDRSAEGTYLFCRQMS